MTIDKSFAYSYPALSNWNTITTTTINPDKETELGTLEVSGTGELRIVNTGGASASEGGVGTGGEGTEKGELAGGNQKSGSGEGTGASSLDPLKEEAEKASKKDSD